MPVVLASLAPAKPLTTRQRVMRSTRAAHNAHRQHAAFPFTFSRSAVLCKRPRRAQRLEAVKHHFAPPAENGPSFLAAKASSALQSSQLARAASQPALHSDALFARRVEVQIQHGGYTYRLRKTALGKLILTK
jgi:hemin uptake protein HemP